MSDYYIIIYIYIIYIYIYQRFIWSVTITSFSVPHFSKETSTPGDTKHIKTKVSKHFIMARPYSWQRDTPGFICTFPSLLVLGIDVQVVPKYLKLVLYKSKFWILINNHKKNSQLPKLSMRMWTPRVNKLCCTIQPNNMLIYIYITFYSGLKLT